MIQVIGLVVLLLSFSKTNAQFLHADGTRIVDESGQEVIWRGIGLGGWMLQEGYMLRTSGPQHEIEEKIEALIGEERTQEFYQAWWANHMRKIDVDSMASWGYNMIRLPMHYKLFTPPIEEEPVAGEITWLDRGFEMTDALLEWCKANNMYLILDLHAAPGGQGENADISDYDSSKPSLWESEANQEKMIALWRKLAERYADEPMLGAYDLINEPNWGFQDHENDPNGCSESQNTLLWDLQKRVTEAIREVDQQHIIVIEGNCWGNNYNGLPTLWDDNLVISYHKYWNPNTQSAIQGMLNMRNDRNVPIWLGETGENSNTWFTNCIDLLESNGIGWSWWPLKKLGGNNPLQIKMNPGYQKVLDYWGGSGAKPSAEEAYTALMQLAEDLKLENNIFHPDVVDAKIRQPHSNDTKPFKNHQILPDQLNVIAASDFDLGKVDYAYSDTEVTNITTSAGGQAWNLGYAYRNDGVDIEETEDESDYSNGYNVGWTEDGEWMLYTVEVDSSGAYDLTIRYAGQAAGVVHLEIDGVDATGPVELPGTGGFQNWTDLVVNEVPVKAGTRKIKLVIDQGGSNLSYFGFFLTSELKDISFGAVSGETTESGAIVLNLNKELDQSTVTSVGFTLSVSGEVVAIDEVSVLGDFQLLLKTAALLKDTDELLLDYSGTEISAADGTGLEQFESLEIRNSLPYHAPIPGKIEAEDFVVNEGLVLENTTDQGGGQNLGYTTAGDYLEYNVAVEETGQYQLEVRIACESNSGKLRFEQLDDQGEVMNQVSVDVPVTGGWQTWQTVKVNMQLTEARGILRVKIVDPEFNLNWFRFSFNGTVLEENTRGAHIFPNPASDELNIYPSMDESWLLELWSMDGQRVFAQESVHNDRVSVSHLPEGLYILNFVSMSTAYQQKIILKR